MEMKNMEYDEEHVYLRRRNTNGECDKHNRTNSKTRKIEADASKNSIFNMLRGNRQFLFKYRILVILAILILYQLVIRNYLFGHHSLRGGKIGSTLDSALKKYQQYKQRKRWRTLFPHLYLDKPRNLYEKVLKWEAESQEISATFCKLTASTIPDTTTSIVPSTDLLIPRFLIQASPEDFSSFDSSWDHYYDRLSLTELEMKWHLWEKILPEKQLYSFYFNLARWDDKVAFWTICALYWYGGIFLSEEVRSFQRTDQNFQFLADRAMTCQTPVLYTIFSEDVEINPIFDVIAASPKHPLLLEVIENIASIPKVGSVRDEIIKLFTKSFTSQNSPYTNKPLSMECQVCPKIDTKYEMNATDMCCDILSETNTIFSLQKIDFSTLPTNIHSKDYVTKPGPISIKWKDNLSKIHFHPKNTIQEKLINSHSEPNFLCNRCLRCGALGRFEKCSFVCNDVYKDTICAPDSNNLVVPLEIVDSSSNINSSIHSQEQNKNTHVHPPKLIPRIIHQTWFEELTPERYPDLVRFQNSWKATGWEYRFYDDKAAQDFIMHHFPSEFVEAYDSIIPGAYKADFFRYLVLLIHGGIYVDIDVMLDVDLDNFITPEMAFFVPRDAPGDMQNEEFCLWNGFLGAAPGHPTIIRAVERSVNLILNKADLFDLEREICLSTGVEMEWWKIRLEPSLMLTGPCALGIALNEAYGFSSLQKIDMGWMRSDPKNLRGFMNGKPGGGDTLILALKKNDINALRLTDVETNVIIATTDIPGLRKKPRKVQSQDLKLLNENERKQIEKKVKPHYSSTGDGNWVWGMKLVYTGESVADAKFIFHTGKNQ